MLLDAASYHPTPPLIQIQIQIQCFYVNPSPSAAPPGPPIICGGNYTNSTGDIYSPNYPDDYPNDATCPYNIIVPEGYVSRG